jgi:hypothetical protein
MLEGWQDIDEVVTVSDFGSGGTNDGLVRGIVVGVFKLGIGALDKDPEKGTESGTAMVEGGPGKGAPKEP